MQCQLRGSCAKGPAHLSLSWVPQAVRQARVVVALLSPPWLLSSTRALDRATCECPGRSMPCAQPLCQEGGRGTGEGSKQPGVSAPCPAYVVHRGIPACTVSHDDRPWQARGRWCAWVARGLVEDASILAMLRAGHNWQWQGQYAVGEVVV